MTRASIFVRAGNWPNEGFWLKSTKLDGFDCLIVAGGTDRGVLYGVFALLSKIAQRRRTSRHLDEIQQPYAPIRWANQWDNLDGSIERGYAGRSIFFDNGNVRDDLTRVRDYARLLASVGINGCAINNVNANPRALQPDFLPQLARVADVFRPWGIRLSIAVDLSSPNSSEAWIHLTLWTRVRPNGGERKRTKFTASSPILAASS